MMESEERSSTASTVSGIYRNILQVRQFLCNLIKYTISFLFLWILWIFIRVPRQFVCSTSPIRLVSLRRNLLLAQPFATIDSGRPT